MGLRLAEGQSQTDWQNLTKLNLGCGQFPKEGFLNVDVDTKSKAQFLHDLSNYPYPFNSNHFELIEADHVFEHLPNVYDVMKEMHRLLKPGGKLIMRVPHYSRGLTHWDHKHGFDVTFPFYFNPEFKGGYTGLHFKLAKMRLRWLSQPYLKHTVMASWKVYLAQALGVVVDALAGFSPFLCTRLWCYWVGGFEEVEFHFVKAKE